VITLLKKEKGGDVEKGPILRYVPTVTRYNPMTSDMKEIVFPFFPMYGKYFFDRFLALSFVFLIPATQLKL
jgi:hypothetical protein